MCILFRSEVRFVDIPTELFFVPFTLQLKIKVNRNQNFLCISGSFLFDVDDIGGENELLVDCFIKGGVARSSRV